MENIDYRSEGIVFDIQRFSIHDGPGIRTIAFLKGCPLSCKWCCNPESQDLKPTVMFKADACIHCGKCLGACKYGALSPDNAALVDRAACKACGECVNVCPTGALVMKGKRMTVSELVRELKKDAGLFRRSKGGITVSGGEPLVQASFLTELLKACKEQGWHTAMETTGLASEAVIEQVFPWVDMALLDIKAMDPAAHRANTGVSNDIILKNSIAISGISPTVVRVPTIPGVNATESEFRAICAHVKTMKGVGTIHILPYHTYGENKYGLMGKEYQFKETPSLTKEEIAGLQRLVEGEGFKCVIGG